jgi:cell division protein FtsI/penicillin-binding protein 2
MRFVVFLLLSLALAQAAAALPPPRKFHFSQIPSETVERGGRVYFTDSSGKEILLTLDSELQRSAEDLLAHYRPPYGAIVAIQPNTGRILAMAGSSRFGIKGEELLGRATFPAASLFKVITGAAAVEKAGLRSGSQIAFRGGNYTLSQWNYQPDPKTDKRRMALGEAMGLSCNGVFARVGLGYLRAAHLEEYAERFGFHIPLVSDFPVQRSAFDTGVSDYELARTAAGFRGAKISPVHAAAVAATVANGGVLLKPYLIDEVRAGSEGLLYRGESEPLGRAISRETALELTEMMLSTTTIGTARRHFKPLQIFQKVKVAGKTGTLSGDNPEGLYLWFIGFAPADNPEIAVAALTIDRGGSRIAASGLASLFLERHFAPRYGVAPRSLVAATPKYTHEAKPATKKKYVRKKVTPVKKPVAKRKRVVKK